MRVIQKMPIGDAVEKTITEKMCHIAFTLLYISHRSNLLSILNKQITTDCFLLIYNPLVCLSHVESVQVKKNNPILPPLLYYYFRITDFVNASSNLPVLKILLFT